MRFERWWWLIGFCVVSLAIHVAIVTHGPQLVTPIQGTKTGEIEIALEPMKEALPKEKVKKAPPKLPPPPRVVRPPIETHATRTLPVAPIIRHPTRTMRIARVDRPDRAIRIPAPDNRKTYANAAPGGIKPDPDESPVAVGLPSGVVDAGATRPVHKTREVPGGGGSPSPSVIPDGKGGAKGPPAPDEDILFNGGGAGGADLPKEAPRIGGGGGRSILSVENPLAKDAIPDETPGLGPGRRGGEGAGAEAGVGYGRGKGIGTRLDGRYALATLNSKKGRGIGAGTGDRIGTRAPGGGNGTGAELPGTGGSGVGYGRGRGIGVGNGSGEGVGDGDGGQPGKRPGIAYGDVAGVLGARGKGGGTGGGPGGPGRGYLFSDRVRGGGRAGGGRLNVVYVLDISGSMEEGNKIGKAKDAVRTAILSLKPYDRFNIITFNKFTFPFADTMQKATEENVQQALAYVDSVRIGPGTNISGALDVALSMEGATHLFLASDGEPTAGIEKFDQLRDFVRQKNGNNVHIDTFAIGLGERFPGMALLKSLAEDNNGSYNYVNLRK